MTVAELRAVLDEYGDHVPVAVIVNDRAGERISNSETDYSVGYYGDEDGSMQVQIEVEL